MKRKVIDSFEGEYEFLSNFYPSEINIGGIKYPTVEHAFQAMKVADTRVRLKIAAAPTPGQAKRMGRSVDLRPDWEQVKMAVMQICLQKKFDIPELREKLLATGNAELIEGNTWHDNCWGSCHCPKCGNKGTNWLGKLLMNRRVMLKNKEDN